MALRKPPPHLRRKGISLLALILIAESVTFAHAVKLWSKFRRGYQQFPDQNPPRKSNGRKAERIFQNFAGVFSKRQPCVTFCCCCKDTLGASQACPNTATRILGSFQGRIRLIDDSESLSPSASGLERRNFATCNDCCTGCSNYMGPCRALRDCQQIPRGGQSAVYSGAEKLADALAGDAALTPYGISLHLWKIAFQAILTTINVACWLIPLRSKKISENKLGLSLANAFSGGVFLSLAFGHLIPECVRGFSDFQEALPYMLVLGGYLLIFFVEKVAFDAHDILHEIEHGVREHSTSGTNDAAKGIADCAQQPSTGRSAVILLGALAVHSILEMMALGLADSFGDCALLTLSIALHQPAESIALLVAFLKSGMPQNQIIQFLSIFSAMGPIGVALGIAVNEFAAPIVDASMVAVVAGTFVYVGATEVIPEEWEESEHKWKKFGALMCGIVSIFMVTQYTMTLVVH